MIFQAGSITSIRVSLFGETTGERDAFGLPVRLNWASAYRGATTVVYGHTPVARIEFVNNTVCVDTGCVFGGKLSALRWPEKEVISVPAAMAYAESKKPFLPDTAAPLLSAQQQHDDVLDRTEVRTSGRDDGGLRDCPLHGRRAGRQQGSGSSGGAGSAGGADLYARDTVRHIPGSAALGGERHQRRGRHDRRWWQR